MTVQKACADRRAPLTNKKGLRLDFVKFVHMKKNRFRAFVFCQLFGKDHRDKSEEHWQKKKNHLEYICTLTQKDKKRGNKTCVPKNLFRGTPHIGLPCKYTLNFISIF